MKYKEKYSVPDRKHFSSKQYKLACLEKATRTRNSLWSVKIVIDKEYFD
jgi:hypothetical protein